MKAWQLFALCVIVLLSFVTLLHLIIDVHLYGSAGMVMCIGVLAIVILFEELLL